MFGTHEMFSSSMLSTISSYKMKRFINIWVKEPIYECTMKSLDNIYTAFQILDPLHSVQYLFHLHLSYIHDVWNENIKYKNLNLHIQ